MSVFKVSGGISSWPVALPALISFTAVVISAVIGSFVFSMQCSKFSGAHLHYACRFLAVHVAFFSGCTTVHVAFSSTNYLITSSFFLYCKKRYLSTQLKKYKKFYHY